MTEKNHEYYVSLEVSKLLKKAGFDWECRKIYYCYREDDDTWELEDNYKIHKHILELDYCLLAPTLDVAQKWLREVKNIDVVISRAMQWKQFYYTIEHEENRTSKIDFMSLLNKDMWWFKYEEAQEAGIKKALELILEKGE